MTNVTMAIDEETLKKARIHALEQGTSLNAVVREFIEAYAQGQDKYTEATASLIAKSNALRGSSGGASWKRDELYER
jgi:hypothetical protein